MASLPEREIRFRTVKLLKPERVQAINVISAYGVLLKINRGEIPMSKTLYEWARKVIVSNSDR